MALVFVHGGPGAYVRDFDRDFLSSFAQEGFDVVLYDQFGAGRSALGDPQGYTHENNLRDLSAVLARIDKPVVLVGQSYGAALVTSALAREDVRRHVAYVVLSEPGRVPGASATSRHGMTEKTTRALDATATPSLAVVVNLAHPRSLLATLLPRSNQFVHQEELINLYTPDVQRLLVSSAFCKGDTGSINSFQTLRFNPLANASISRDVRHATTPSLRDLKAPVLMLLGECSYIPRGRAMQYFEVFTIARSQVIANVGHVLWGNAEGREVARDAILRFIDGRQAALPNEPTASTADAFVSSGG